MNRMAGANILYIGVQHRPVVESGENEFDSDR